MSKNKQHLIDIANYPRLHKHPKSLTGGACLNRHRPEPPSKVSQRDSCWYRWQAYDKMKSEAKAYYDYPKYKSLTQHPTDFLRVGRRGMSNHPIRKLPRPSLTSGTTGSPVPGRFPAARSRIFLNVRQHPTTTRRITSSPTGNSPTPSKKCFRKSARAPSSRCAADCWRHSTT